MMEPNKLAGELNRVLVEADKNKKAWATFERWAFANLGESRTGGLERHEWMKRILDATWSRVMRPEELEEKLRTERLTGQSEGYNSGFKDGRNSGGLTRGEFDILRKLINNIGFEVEIGANSVALKALKDTPVKVTNTGVDVRRSNAEAVLYSLGWSYDEVQRLWKRPEEQAIDRATHLGDINFRTGTTVGKVSAPEPGPLLTADGKSVIVNKGEYDFLVQFKDRTLDMDRDERKKLASAGLWFDYGGFGDGPGYLRPIERGSSQMEWREVKDFDAKVNGIPVKVNGLIGTHRENWKHTL